MFSVVIRIRNPLILILIEPQLQWQYYVIIEDIVHWQMPNLPSRVNDFKLYGQWTVYAVSTFSHNASRTHLTKIPTCSFRFRF